MKGLDALLSEHPFFEGMKPDELKFLAGCASNAVYEAGEYLFHEGEPADRFFLVRRGHVSVQLHAPGRGAVSIMTAKDGEVVGFSWLLTPYRWEWDARALDLTRTVIFDGECLRQKCDEDPQLGYELMKRLTRVMMVRLEAASLQLADVYGERAAAP